MSSSRGEPAISLAHVTDDLARRIRERRTALNLSQVEAAAEIGVSLRTLQSWEAGGTFPWPRHRRAIAEFLADEAVA